MPSRSFLCLTVALLWAGAAVAADPAVVIQNTASGWDASQGKGEHRVFTGAVGEKSAWQFDAHDFGAGKLWSGETTLGLVYVAGELPSPRGERARLTLWSARPLRGTFEVYRVTTPWLAAASAGGPPKPIQDGPYRGGGLTLADTTGTPLDTQDVAGGHEVTFDVTAAVDHWAADPAGNHGLLLRRVGGGEATFVGSAAERRGFTPRLSIGAVAQAQAAPDAPWLHTDLAKASSWKEAGFVEPWNKKGHLRLAPDETGRQVLDIAVEASSGVNLMSRPGDLAALRPEVGKVYRIQFEGRAVGQVEGVTLHLRQDAAPHAWHGTDSFPISTQWAVYETQIKPRETVDGCGLYFEFRGVGHYQLRWVRVAELDAFDVSAISAADATPRGELLSNPDFTLGPAGWHFTVPEWGDHARRYFAPDHDRNRFFPRGDGAGVRFRNEAGLFGFLSHTRLLELRFGQSYRIRVRGDAQDGDAFLWIERPAMHIHKPHKIALRFVGGVAEATYTHRVPEHGTLSIRPQQYFVQVEHFGKAPLTVESVSVVEGDADVAVAQAAVVVEGLGGPLGHVAHDGAALRAVVRATGLPPGGGVLLQLTDARGRVAHEAPVTLSQATGGVMQGQAPLPVLPWGWYQAEAKVSGGAAHGVPARFVVTPRVERPRPIVGAHVSPHDPRQARHLRELGAAAARCFEFSWPALEPRQGQYEFPMRQLQHYLDAGLEPMVILNGSPRWASSAPQDLLQNPDPWAGWSSYPPRDIEDWRRFVARTATLLKGKVRVYQVWNEPNGYFLKVNPQHGRSLPQAYTELVRVAAEEIRRVDPHATVVAGATAGAAMSFFEQCFDLGLLDHCNTISFHPYGEDNALGHAPFAAYVRQYHELMRTRGHDPLPVWDCESGYNIAEGAAGLDGSTRLIQGLIGREAAGIGRYFIYTSNPRAFPDQANFHMVSGFADQPLVAAALLPVYVRLLDGLTFAADHSDLEQGTRLYEFRGGARTVLVGWHLADEAHRDAPAPAPGRWQPLDCFGQPAGDARDGQLQLTRALRYFVKANPSATP